ncbi:hypothetical protein L6164_026414 [Bauhinia variegata]|uniref:Uncharacterized protein n=1 Tax=Bauhinia variegata TaxID=167791 RepID=A0ACB9LQC5_BAUVA|nr:hypothetical protein L6164_026414 [Bauhinia variegata]
MEFLSLVVGKLLDYTVAPITKQVGYLIFYHSNVKELREEAEALQRERERVQHAVDTAVRNGELIEGDVKKWLEEVDEISLEFDELNKDERHANADCSTRPFPNFCFRHKLSRRSKKMKVVIAETIARRNFDRVSYREVPKLTRLTSSEFTLKEFTKELGEPKIFSKLGSRVSEQNDIMKALEDPMVQTIGVHGLPGVGKTTLVEAVAKKAQKHGLFDVVVLLKVTQNPDLEKIQLQIADMLGLKFEEQSLIGRACRLRHRLNLNHERILIILDDIWRELNMDEIGIPCVHEGLKILMTSRSQGILSDKMNTHVNFLLQVLPWVEAWKLFMDKAQFDESAVSGEFLSIATQVVKECAGLPMAIVIVATALKNKSLFEWKDTLRQLQSPTLTNITGEQNQIYNAIKVSYDRLENELLKSIFLLFGVMQSNSLITDLFNVSVGLGLFKDIYNLEEA